MRLRTALACHEQRVKLHRERPVERGVSTTVPDGMSDVHHFAAGTSSVWSSRLGDSGEPWISPVESGDGRADSKQGSSTLELFGVLAGDGVRLVKWLSEVGWFHSVAP